MPFLPDFQERGEALLKIQVSLMKIPPLDTIPENSSVKVLKSYLQKKEYCNFWPDSCMLVYLFIVIFFQQSSYRTNGPNMRGLIQTEIKNSSALCK